MKISVFTEISRLKFINDFVKKRVPCVLKSAFTYLPAISRWMQNESSQPSQLNMKYFLSLIESSGTDPYVDVEAGRFKPVKSTINGHDGDDEFVRTRIPLSLFLKMSSMKVGPPEYSNLYLAQTSLLESLPGLENDMMPLPSYLPSARHIYGCSTWIGQNTFTPRHFDPNDNLYIMIGGKKKIRLWKPDEVEGNQKRRGGLGNDNFSEAGPSDIVYDQVELEAGDGLYIPEKWWHEVSSIGEDVTASVNWWFREPS
ncbi:hypothetical protein V1512DRAFT_268733 [Lipomyces arxii]|uniref:uncharacterized protein n=1 Tax=Lipomyces arxii TaxID=56418 RepID=UPI0034CF0246